jgi:predicted lysophospholipase L1 biosynthesis ABC-type transport system permease subunit
MKSRQFRKGLTTLVVAACLALAATPVAWGQSLDEAARQAARQHDAKVLSAQTVQEGKRRVHVIKLLTKDGVVKTVRVPVREG